MKYRFYKEDNNWYVDIPAFIEGGGEKSDLEMVAGADEFLDYISNNGTEISLNISLDKIDCRATLVLVKAYDGLDGADYVATIKDKTINIWLCAVMLYIFDKYPEHLYIN